ncbi:MAG: hypothetical protein HFI34_12585 [Lachnospiraceae bacterium]|nr:hypothetical protein [Lachnospiraceae bacterium]
MKKRIITGLASGLLIVALLITGCSGSSVSESSDGKITVESGNPSNPSGNVLQNGTLITVGDIKEKYLENNNCAMPLYNVAPDEEFEFHLKYNLFEEETDRGIVTVHTHVTCKEESAIYAYETYEETESGSVLKISPVSGVLLNETQQKQYLKEDKAVWGNAPIYYLAIHYDIEADTMVKLETPVIIPFTIRQEVPAPNVKGVVDSTGRLKLVWDPVEGASEYRIYTLSNSDQQWTGDNNSLVCGAQTGYNECSFLFDASTTETEFDDFAGEGSHSIAVHHRSVSDREYIIGQNYSVMGEYYVSAVVDGKESGFSTGIRTSDLILPFKLTDEADIMFETYEDVSQLPLKLDVINIDGSITARKVLYTLQMENTYLGTSFPEYKYTIEGTAITGCVSIDTEDIAGLPETIGENTPSGNMEPENGINKAPDKDVDTIIKPSDDIEETTEEDTDIEETTEEEPDTEETTEEETNTEEITTEKQATGEPGSVKSLVQEQLENTKKHIEIANDKGVQKPGEKVVIFADSAAEEWLAVNLVNGVTDISVEGFPELQDPNILEDVLYKVYYQNPYIMGFYRFEYNYQNLTLKIGYVYNADEIAEKQKEAALEAQKITDEIIKDEMTDEEKQLAIYEYLENNCEYDRAALEDAEKNNFKKTEDNTYEDAFNVYGIIVDKKGVCQSYAYAYKLLASFSGLDCRVMTGSLNGNLPHAWNIVNINGGWYQVDATNNGKTTGIPYFLFNADTDMAEQTGYIFDFLFDLDSEIPGYQIDNDTHEYYFSRKMAVSDVQSYGEVLDRIVTPENTTLCVRYTAKHFDQDELVRVVGEVYYKHGLENKLSTLKFGSTNGYLILISE